MWCYMQHIKRLFCLLLGINIFERCHLIDWINLNKVLLEHSTYIAILTDLVELVRVVLHTKHCTTMGPEEYEVLVCLLSEKKNTATAKNLTSESKN